MGWKPFVGAGLAQGAQSSHVSESHDDGRLRYDFSSTVVSSAILEEVVSVC